MISLVFNWRQWLASYIGRWCKYSWCMFLESHQASNLLWSMKGCSRAMPRFKRSSNFNKHKAHATATCSSARRALESRWPGRSFRRCVRLVWSAQTNMCSACVMEFWFRSAEWEFVLHYFCFGMPFVQYPPLWLILARSRWKLKITSESQRSI